MSRRGEGLEPVEHQIDNLVWKRADGRVRAQAKAVWDQVEERIWAQVVGQVGSQVLVLAFGQVADRTKEEQEGK